MLLSHAFEDKVVVHQQKKVLESHQLFIFYEHVLKNILKKISLHMRQDG
jgi:hypothetical protein